MWQRLQSVMTGPQTEVWASCQRVAPRPFSLPAKNDGHREMNASCRSDFSVRNRPAEAVVERAFRDPQPAPGPGTAAADKTRTRFAWRSGRPRELNAGGLPAPPTRPLHRVHSKNSQMRFWYSYTYSVSNL